jgi:hypothetical protein
MIYRFTFDPDGSPQVVDDPINWNDSELSIERDNDIKGIFYQYTANLEWVGSAYSYIDALDTASDCWEFDVLIEFKVNPDDAFQTLFNGRIYSYDVEFDLQKQIAKCKIVDQNLTQIILDRQDLTINSGSNKTLNGSTISGLTPTSISLSAVAGDDSNTASSPMYYVDDVVEHIVKSITDDQVAFDSDWLQTDENQVARWRLTVGSIALSSTFTIIMQTDIGLFTGSETNATGSTDTTVFVCLVRDVISDSSVTGKTFDMGAPFRVQKIGSGVYEIFSAFDISAITISGGTINSTQKINDTTTGMRGLAISLGSVIRYNWAGTAVTGVVKLSLADCLRELNRFFDVTFKIFDDGGTPTMKLEKTETFFDQASPASVTITGVRNISARRNSDFKLNSINQSDGADTFQTDTIAFAGTSPDTLMIDENTHQPRAYVSTEQCGQSAVNAENTWTASNQAIDSLIQNQEHFDNTFVVIDTNKSTNSARLYLVSNLTIGLTITPAFRLYNAFLGTLWRQKYWMVSTGKQVKSENVEFDNDTIILDKEYEFTAPISQVDVNAIVADPSVKISVSGEGLTATDMWILSMSVDIKTGLVQFKTISNE